MNTRLAQACSLVVVATLSVCSGRAAAQIERFGEVDVLGSSQAVRVHAQHLAFTAQVFALDGNGGIDAAADAGAQTKIVLNHLRELLQHNVQGSLEDVTKLNVYVAHAADVPAVRSEFARAFPRTQRPAVALVVTPLPVSGALVAVDAVAVDRRRSGNLPLVRGTWRFHDNGKFGIPANPPAGVMVVPGDHLILVSGQAKPGELRESVRKTCDSLLKTVQWCGGETTSVAQVKVFLGSMDDVPAVLEEIAAAFQNREPVPPVSFVQWTNTGPTEIEVIAAGLGDSRSAGQGEPVRYLTPPWMTASAVYSKVAVTHSASLIFTSGLYGTPDADGEAQVTSIFSELETAVRAAGSDLAHLAKATYYVTNNDAGTMLNKLRPDYYDPQRPPAASKASVQAVGQQGCSITLDMIAVPALDRQAP